MIPHEYSTSFGNSFDQVNLGALLPLVITAVLFYLTYASTLRHQLQVPPKHTGNSPHKSIRAGIINGCSAYVDIDAVVSIPLTILMTLAAAYCLVFFHTLSYLFAEWYTAEFNRARRNEKVAMKEMSWIAKMKHTFLLSNAGDAWNTILNINYGVVDLWLVFG